MTAIDVFDPLDIDARDFSPDEGDRFDAVKVFIADKVKADDLDGDEFAEPTLAASPFIIEFDAFNEPAPLDTERAGLIWELVPVRDWAIRLRAPLVSLAFHLLPLIAVILLPLLLIEPPPPIPVQLVFEQPPPPPPPPPEPQQKPQQQQQQPPPPKMEAGRLSSVDMGSIKQNMDLGRSADPVKPPSAAERQPDPAETQTATATPPLPMAKPTPPREKSALQAPKPSGANVPHHDDTPHEASHHARYEGTASTRDEYLAYLVSLTRQHIGLLPMSFIAGRRGETVVSVVVYDNGRIGALSVIRSSGYPDIDQRIEQMIAAVGKFPPLPQWYQGNAVQLELTLKFPEALEHP